MKPALHFFTPLAHKERSTMTFTSLFFWLFTGLAGMAYFIFGKKTQDFWFMIAGLGLMIFPMCFSTPVAAAVSIAMLALPFAAQRWL